ncbi:hypothetical protein A3A41_01080 [Candidatus Kaiserbacteria bacterium RIFCSPLOWO2_01_FULL_54_22]|nr:MAG: hypothetical protein A3A41_01080 [Candidatus Kaiserbacteria bacterium RIFCSPLOWO2_01_FULL_54_22]
MSSPERSLEQKSAGGRNGFPKEVEAEALAIVQHTANEYEQKNPENTAWVRGVIRRIDFREFQLMYGELAQKAGVKNINVVQPRDIYIRDTEGDDGGDADYDPMSNAMTMDGDLIAKARGPAPFEEPKFRNEIFAVSLILHQIAHEYTHATGYIGYGKIDLDDGRNIDAVRMGLSQALFRTEDPGNDYYVMFDLFNEGVTEHIAMMMSREYLRRSPLSMPNGDTLESAQFEEFLALQNDEKDDYGAAVEFFGKISAYLAKECEVPQDLVEKAFIRAYYRGEELPVVLLDETVGKEFSKMLMRAKDSEDFNDLVESYILPRASNSLIDQWKRFFGFLGRRIK